MSWYLDVKRNSKWAYAPKVFTDTECDHIIKLGNELKFENGEVDVKQGPIDKSLRKGAVGFFNPEDRSLEGLYKKLTDVITYVNKQFWDYDLHYIEKLQFTTYTEKGDFYTRHIDELGVYTHSRKLSFSVQLSNPDDYEGSDLLMHIESEPSPTTKQRGDVIFFPSHVLHEVTPLISGARYSLVGWVCGPRFR